MNISAQLLLTLAGALFVSAAVAEPIKITSPELLDRQLIDSKQSVLFVLCRGSAQCEQVQTLLTQAEVDGRVTKAFSESERAGGKKVKIAFADAADLPLLSEGWDKEDSDLCLKDKSKTEAQCADLAYPVFILQRVTGSSFGLEELMRGTADKDAAVNMILQSISTSLPSQSSPEQIP
ncbi:MAG: hypothetical protein C0469_00140 [Cyanobacteria bacterium DS2.3.42]|nr:hypothetical protein [Cyanobacteria bacterium DS2.3.42]